MFYAGKTPSVDFELMLGFCPSFADGEIDLGSI